MSDHRELPKLGEFCTCATAGGKCECGNDYQKEANENAEKKWRGQSQAHHLLPVSSVVFYVRGNEKLELALKVTEWCINHAENMLKMPLWGTTVKHYCSWKPAIRASKPGFAGIPQHLVGHSDYNDEVSSYLLSQMAKYEAAKKKEDHAVKASAIFAALKDLQTHMRTELDERGRERSGGTHVAWQRAANSLKTGNVYKKWYLPFSMAMYPEEQSFPERLDVESVREWGKRLASF